MNSNMIHNFINLLIVLVTALGTFDGSVFVGPDVALKIVGALALLKLLMNAVRDGVTGMAAPQPPVKK